MSADNTNAPDQKKPSEGLAELRSDIDTKLLAVQEQLKAMNQSYAQGLDNIAQRMTSPTREETIDDSDVFSPAKLRDKILTEATRTTNEILAENRKKDLAIYQMTQEYPEIQSDPKLQNQITEALKTLPKSMQETADGYEIAILKAVAKQGILPKSKRPTPNSSDDFSMSSRSAGGRPKAREKVAAETLAISELLGRDIKDPEVLKRLEEATNRDTYNRYR